MSDKDERARGPHPPRIARLIAAPALAAATFILIFVGGLVTSTGSALAVPDWPLSFGKFFPRMEGGVLYEHGHRMAAGTVTILTLVLMALGRGGARTEMGPKRRAVCFRPDNRTGGAGRAHRAAAVAAGDCGQSRGHRAGVLLPDGCPCPVHQSTMEDAGERLNRPGIAAGPGCRARGAYHHGDLHADPGRCGDASHGRGAGDSGLSAFVRPYHAAAGFGLYAINFAHRCGAIVVTRFRPAGPWRECSARIATNRGCGVRRWV